jgi:hypothetical protein
VQVGVEIIQRAIRRPAKTIAANAGLEGDVIVGKLLEMTGEETVGFNAAVGRFEDLVKAGVIDPIKVGGRGALLGCRALLGAECGMLAAGRCWALGALKCCAMRCAVWVAVVAPHDVHPPSCIFPAL